MMQCLNTYIKTIQQKLNFYLFIDYPAKAEAAKAKAEAAKVKAEAAKAKAVTVKFFL